MMIIVIHGTVQLNECNFYSDFVLRSIIVCSVAYNQHPSPDSVDVKMCKYSNIQEYLHELGNVLNKIDKVLIEKAYLLLVTDLSQRLTSQFLVLQ